MMTCMFKGKSLRSCGECNLLPELTLTHRMAIINLAPVVPRVDNAIQRISIGKTNYDIRWIVLSTL